MLWGRLFFLNSSTHLSVSEGIHYNRPCRIVLAFSCLSPDTFPHPAAQSPWSTSQPHLPLPKYNDMDSHVLGVSVPCSFLLSHDLQSSCAGVGVCFSLQPAVGITALVDCRNTLRLQYEIQCKPRKNSC